jgi:hypothetical protein
MIMKKDIINLNDKLNSVDEVSGNPTKKINPLRIENKQNKVLRTKIIGLDTITGDKLFETENQIVLGGALFILEKIFNLEAPINVEYLNDIMGICVNEPIEELYPKETKVCLFGVGMGGCGDASRSVVDVKYFEREIFDMIPFRITDDPMTGSDASKYWFKRYEDDGKTSYFLKSFEHEPEIKVLWKDGEEGEDGSEVASGVHNTSRTEPIETFVEMVLKIDKKDCREYFEINGDIEAARINSIGLFTGILSTNERGVPEYKQVKLFSKLNIPNEMLVLSKDITIVYRIYTS